MEIGRSARIKFQKLFGQNKILDPGPSTFVGINKEGKLTGFSSIRVSSSHGIYAENPIKCYSYDQFKEVGGRLSDLLQELLVFNLGKKVDAYLDGREKPLSLDQIKKKVLVLKKNEFSPRSGGGPHPYYSVIHDLIEK